MGYLDSALVLLFVGLVVAAVARFIAGRYIDRRVRFLTAHHATEYSKLRHAKDREERRADELIDKISRHNQEMIALRGDAEQEKENSKQREVLLSARIELLETQLDQWANGDSPEQKARVANEFFGAEYVRLQEQMKELYAFMHKQFPEDLEEAQLRNTPILKAAQIVLFTQKRKIAELELS